MTKLWPVVVACASFTLLCLLPAQLSAYVASYSGSSGCHHNGTWYADKSIVPTTAKCLNCQCNKKTLVCRLKVCPELPMPPPRGCVIVQMKGTCCPYLSCARLEAFYKIPTTRRIIAYLDHYERESIDRVVNDNMLQRRSDDSETDLYVCVKNGTVYKSGSAMSSSSLCSYCYCIGGTEKCVKPKCMLPVEGCKPIFVDSTCCPVRYDCSSKPSGKSSSEVRYRKTSNKHYLRMSQRMQRNRGCTVGQQFYAEGQKMKSDADKPCDICFCIRGSRRCAPKKCSPALKNCLPVIPKGQCCPSSYDCGSQRDYRRSQNSRQFNLFSMLFGDQQNEEVPGGTSTKHRNPTKRMPAVQYPPDRHPGVTSKRNGSAIAEKGILDTIRQGLEFIDTNNNQMLADNLDLVALQTPTTVKKVKSTTPAPSRHTTASTSEVNFLDLLLGPEEPEVPVRPPPKVPLQAPEEKTASPYDGLSWVDLLLGPDEDEIDEVKKTTISSATVNDKIDVTDSSTNQPPAFDTTNSIDRLDAFVEESSGNGELGVGELEAKDQEHYQTERPEEESTSEAVINTKENTESTLIEETTQEVPSKLEKDSKDSGEATTIRPSIIRPSPSTTSPTKITTSRPQPPRTTTSVSLKTTTKQPPKIHKTQSQPAPQKETLLKTAAMPLEESKPLPMINTSTPTTPATKKPDLFSAFLDGISDIFDEETTTNKTAKIAESNTSSPISTAPTKSSPALTIQPMIVNRPPPMFKPLPSNQPHKRINSKIANLTVSSPPPIIPLKAMANVTVKPPKVEMPTTTTPTIIPSRSSSTTARPSSTPTPPSTTPPPTPSTAVSTTTTTTTTSTTTTTTVKPLLIQTNPTILEAEPPEAEPTLPPSLPNLKIIPFLLKDAVKPEAIQPASTYDYYHSNIPASAKIDFGIYDDASMYPAITERYPSYPEVQDDTKAEYIYKFKVEGPVEAVSSTAGKLDGAGAVTAFLNYPVGAGLTQKGFSPPTETEGGFVPKEPLIINDDELPESVSVKLSDSYQVTKHIIDITTAEPVVMNTTKLIDLTTPDPFKDVIKTEPPPDLTSLIEDKQKILIVQPQEPVAAAAVVKEENVTPQALKVEDIPVETVIIRQRNPVHTKPTTVKVPINSTHMSVNPYQDDNTSLGSLLDLLLEEEHEEASHFLGLSTSSSTTTTAVPPFRTLPPVTISRPAVESTISSMSTSTTTTKTRSTNRPASKPTRNKNSSSSGSSVAGGAQKVKSKPKIGQRTSNTTTTGHKSSGGKRRPPLAAATTKASAIRIGSSTHKQRPVSSSPSTIAPIRPTVGSTIAATPSADPAASTSATAPYLLSPFDKLPFMDASFEVKSSATSTNSPYPTTIAPSTIAPIITTSAPLTPQKSNVNLLGLVHYKNSINRFEGLEPAYQNYPTTATTTTAAATVSPERSAAITDTHQHHHAPTNSLIDPTGMLKLAGCNIYGRMYRVGRIILELSSACVECKCTEVGVKCGPLDC